MPEASRPPVRRVMPVVIGIALTCVFLALLAYLGQRRSSQQPVILQLTILSPRAGETVDSPLIVRFAASHAVSLMPTGWGFERLHLHAWIDGVAYMPAAADIRAADGALHTWTIASARRGARQIQLGWADAAHRELSVGRSDSVKVLIR